MPQQCLPVGLLRPPHGAEIAPHHLAPAPRWIERLIFIMPQQHVNLRHRYLVPGLALIFHAPRHPFELGLKTPQFVSQLRRQIVRLDKGD